MKKSFFLFRALGAGVFSVLLSLGAFSQTTIPLEEAAKHIGDSVTLSGKVFGARFLENAEKQPTLINLGAAFPHQMLTVVIFGGERKLFPYKPEEELLNRTVTVTGKIELYRDKPQIVIRQASQLREAEEKK